MNYDKSKEYIKDTNTALGRKERNELLDPLAEIKDPNSCPKCGTPMDTASQEIEGEFMTFGVCPECGNKEE
jgi:ribosomal protein L37AE/L43A